MIQEMFSMVSWLRRAPLTLLGIAALASGCGGGNEQRCPAAFSGLQRSGTGARCLPDSIRNGGARFTKRPFQVIVDRAGVVVFGPRGHGGFTLDERKPGSDDGYLGALAPDLTPSWFDVAPRETTANDYNQLTANDSAVYAVASGSNGAMMLVFDRATGARGPVVPLGFAGVDHAVAIRDGVRMILTQYVDAEGRVVENSAQSGNTLRAVTHVASLDRTGRIIARSSALSVSEGLFRLVIDDTGAGFVVHRFGRRPSTWTTMTLGADGRVGTPSSFPSSMTEDAFSPAVTHDALGVLQVDGGALIVEPWPTRTGLELTWLASNGALARRASIATPPWCSNARVSFNDACMTEFAAGRAGSVALTGALSDHTAFADVVSPTGVARHVFGPAGSAYGTRAISWHVAFDDRGRVVVAGGFDHDIEPGSTKRSMFFVRLPDR